MHNFFTASDENLVVTYHHSLYLSAIYLLPDNLSLLYLSLPRSITPPVWISKQNLDPGFTRAASPWAILKPNLTPIAHCKLKGVVLKPSLYVYTSGALEAFYCFKSINLKVRLL